MQTQDSHYDAIVIGGGFYGCAIAIYLASSRRFKRVLIVEQENALLQRASYNNQARVHNGYHYPRSFTTAYRSRVNLPKFIRDWPSAVRKDFTSLYAIAKRNSKVNGKQFERFCHEIGAYIEPAGQDFTNLFESRLIERVYLTEEYVFNTTKLAAWAQEEISRFNIDLLLETKAVAINRSTENKSELIVVGSQKQNKSFQSSYIFNCTYSGLNHLNGNFSAVGASLKHEITEMALVDLPNELRNIGITVMDGAYFSIMPFPARGLHTLSHVRYTPHLHWNDTKAINPYQKILEYSCDTASYIPSVMTAKYIDSLFEVKTVLVKNEGDDGRPILFEKHSELFGCFSILGGKIDNIYDVLEKLDAEAFVLESAIH